VTGTIRYTVPFDAGPTTVQARWLAAGLSDRRVGFMPAVFVVHQGRKDCNAGKK